MAVELLARFLQAPDGKRRMCEPVRMRAEQDRIETGKSSAHAYSQDQGKRNYRCLARILFDPIFRFHDSRGRRGRSTRGTHAFARKLRRIAYVTRRFIKNLAGFLARLTRSTSNKVAGVFRVSYGFVLCAPGSLAQLLFIRETLSFGAYFPGAVGYRLGPALGRRPRYARAFFDQIPNPKFFVKLTRFATRRPVQFVKLFLVVSHPFASTERNVKPPHCTSPGTEEFALAGCALTTQSRPRRLAS